MRPAHEDLSSGSQCHRCWVCGNISMNTATGGTNKPPPERQLSFRTEGPYSSTWKSYHLVHLPITYHLRTPNPALYTLSSHLTRAFVESKSTWTPRCFARRTLNRYRVAIALTVCLILMHLTHQPMSLLDFWAHRSYGHETASWYSLPAVLVVQWWALLCYVCGFCSKGGLVW